MRRASFSFFAPIIALGTLVSCGPSDEATLPGDVAAENREFGTLERQAAEALSLGNQETLAQETTAYGRALLCSMALDALIERVGQGSLLPDTQVRGLENLRQDFDREASRLAQEAQKTAEDIALDREEAEKRVPDVGERSQIAIGCIRSAT